MSGQYTSENGVEYAAETSRRYATEPSSDFTERTTCAVVMKILQDEAARIDAVRTVYLRPDGYEFVMTGADDSPDLYETCAEVAVRVQAAIDKTGTVYVEGGWCRNQAPIEGWLVAYSRER